MLELLHHAKPLPPYVSPLVVLESVARTLRSDETMVKDMVNAGLSAMMRVAYGDKPEPEPVDPAPVVEVKPAKLTQMELDAIEGMVALGEHRGHARRLLDRVKLEQPDIKDCGALIGQMLKIRK
jgi:hypothetical protein